MARSPEEIFSRRLKSEAMLSKSGLRRAYGGSYPAEPIPPQSCTYPLSATLEQLQALDPSIDYRLVLSEGDQRGAFQVGGENAGHVAAPSSLAQAIDLSSGQRQIAVRFELPALGFDGNQGTDFQVMSFDLVSPTTGRSHRVGAHLDLRTNPHHYNFYVSGYDSVGGPVFVNQETPEDWPPGTYEFTLLIDADTGVVTVKLGDAVIEFNTPIDNFMPADDYIVVVSGSDWARFTDEYAPFAPALPGNLGKEFAALLITDTAQMAYPFEDVPNVCNT